MRAKSVTFSFLLSMPQHTWIRADLRCRGNILILVLMLFALLLYILKIAFYEYWVSSLGLVSMTSFFP